MSETPLKLPTNFNPKTNLIFRREGDRTYHAPRLGAELAADLLANGTPEDIFLAEKVLDATLACQETREGDPHIGNFLWEREDEAVEDLNAVQFCLFQLIPTMITQGHLLSTEMQGRVRHAIRLGLEEIRRIDVHFRYTNIVVKDITNTCLGGECLDDEEFSQRGYKKFLDWMQFTTRNGCAYEFNSPNYAGVTLRVLNRLGDLVKHAPTRVGARAMSARLGLSAALHINPATGRWSGPFSRAYSGGLFCQTPPEIHTVREWLDNGTIPSWISDALDYRPERMMLTETADSDNGVGITTYHSNSFALGVSTQELTSQANRFIAGQSACFVAHHNTDRDQTGVIYSRYVLEDRWLGDFRSTPSRGTTQILFEEGCFRGVQIASKAIALYTPKILGAWEPCKSAKAVICWDDRDLVDSIWVNGEKVDALPVEIPLNATVVVVTGPLLTAVRPLHCTDLGRNAPIRLIENGQHLFFELYNYLGPPKTFWEQAHPGSFYQGKPQCGFYVELAERSDYPNPRAFSETVARGILVDKSDPPETYDASKERIWHVEYGRETEKIGIEVELFEWKISRRWTQDGDLGWPQLESPIARQSQSGSVAVGDATLTCGPEPAWLFASPETNCFVAAYHGSIPEPLTLTVPNGIVKIEAIGTGTVVWKDGQVAIEAEGLIGTPNVSGGRLV